MIPLPYKLLAAALAIAALLAALFFAEQHVEGLGYDRRAAEDAAAIEKQKAEAATTLAAETEKTRLLEKSLQRATQKQDLQDAKQKTETDVLAARLRALAGPAGRLRDPNAAPDGCGRGGSSAPGADPAAPADRPDDSTEAGGLLSAELSGLLQSRLADAEAISAAYSSCRADAYTVRGTTPPPP